MQKNIDTIKIINNIHATCVRNYAIRQAITDNSLNLFHSDFWRVIYNSTLDITIIEWCKLFGAYSEKTHWKKCAVRGVTDVDKQILEVCKITKVEFEAVRQSILNYRNKNVSHIDIDKWRGDIPFLQIALEITYTSFDIFAKKNGISGCNVKRLFNEEYDETMKIINTFIK